MFFCSCFEVPVPPLRRNRPVVPIVTGSRAGRSAKTAVMLPGLMLLLLLLLSCSRGFIITFQALFNFRISTSEGLAL